MKNGRTIFMKLCWRRQNCPSLWIHQYSKESEEHPITPYYNLLKVHINLRKRTILVHQKKTIVQFTMKPWIVWLTHWKNKCYDMHELFLLKSPNSEDVEKERKYIDTVYNEELDYHSLKNEIDTLKIILNGNIAQCFDDILKCVKGQQHQLMKMPNILNLLKLLLVNPATFTTAERSFYLARRLETWMR